MESVASKLKINFGFWHNELDNSIVVSVGSENKSDIARISIDLFESMRVYFRDASWRIGSIHREVRDYRDGLFSWHGISS